MDTQSWRKRKAARRGKWDQKAVQFAAQVQQVISQKTETKYYDIGLENNQLFHNLGWGIPVTGIPTSVQSVPGFFNPWINISLGTARFNRIADKIQPVGMSLTLYLATKHDRPNTKFRVIVCRVPKMYNNTVTTVSFDPFQIPNQGILGNNLVFPLDKDKGVKALYDKVHDMGMNTQQWNGAGGKEMTKTVKIWLQRKTSRPIQYDTNGFTIVNNPLAVYVVPYEQFSTLTTDNIGSFAGFMRMYYKDI